VGREVVTGMEDNRVYRSGLASETVIYGPSGLRKGDERPAYTR